PAPGRRHCEAMLMPKQSRVDWNVEPGMQNPEPRTQEKIKSELTGGTERETDFSLRSEIKNRNPESSWGM
ncbi:hypothetical protein MUP29_06375, partial [bacterium]|nr:hypothetical protein [bacterium]